MSQNPGSKWSWTIFGLLAIVAAAFVLPVVRWIYLIRLMPAELDTSASVGDAFGPVNALISFFGLALVAWTLWIQRQELQLQREELKQSTNALRAQSQDLQQQQREMHRQRMMLQFSQLIAQATSASSLVRFKSSFGDEAIQQLLQFVSKINANEERWDTYCGYLVKPCVTTPLRTVTRCLSAAASIHDIPELWTEHDRRYMASLALACISNEATDLIWVLNAVAALGPDSHASWHTSAATLGFPCPANMLVTGTDQRNALRKYLAINRT